MGKKSPPPKPPDLTPISDAQLQIARESNELAREQLGLSREQYAFFMENAKEELALARTQADRLFEFQNKAFESDEAMKEFSKQLGQQQMDAMNLQMDYAKKDRERYEQVFLPMQDQYIKEAQEYDTPEKRAAAAAAAMGDTQRQAEVARQNADQRLRSMGLDPSQMRSASLLQTQDVMNSAQQAAAANQARLQVENQGRAMRADAMNLGMGLPAQSTSSFAGAGAAGQGALGSAQAGQASTLGAIGAGANVGQTAMGFRSGALNNLAALTGSPMQWAQMGGGNLGQASGAYGNAANTINSGYQNSMSNWQAGQQQAQQQFNNIMGVAGMAMMMAEGGEVNIDDYYAEGGFAKVWDKVKQGFKENRTEARKEAGFIEKGAGHGEGGSLSMRDKAKNLQAGAGVAAKAMGGGFGGGGGEMEPIQTAGPMENQIPGYAEGGTAMRERDVPMQGPMGRRDRGGGGKMDPRGGRPMPGTGGPMPPDRMAQMQGGGGGKMKPGQAGPPQMPPQMPQGQGGGKMRPGQAGPPQMPQTGGVLPPHMRGGAPGGAGQTGPVPGGGMPQMTPEQQQQLTMAMAANKQGKMNPRGGGVVGPAQPQPGMPAPQPYNPQMAAMVAEGGYFAEGGGYGYGGGGAMYPAFAEGGSPMQRPQRARGVQPSRQSRDLIPAFLAEGEYVLPADVVRSLGIEKIDKLVQKYHRENS